MKVVAKAYKKGSKVRCYDQKQLENDLSALRDGDLLITIDTDTEKKTRPQQGYYWSTLTHHTLIILRDICGYVEYQTPEDAHEFLKYMFNPVFVTVTDEETGEVKKVRLPGSTKKMKKGEKMKYIDSIILWGWDKFNYTFPPPRKKSDKYNF